MSTPSGNTPPATTGPEPDADQRQRFDAFELAIVLSQFDLGPIISIKEFRRGSRRSPKLILTTEDGRYLLKRRTADPEKVAFCHELQFHMIRHGFPLPKLIRTRSDKSMLTRDRCIYELFSYVRGIGYDKSDSATANAGRLLGRFHEMAGKFRSNSTLPTTSFHRAGSLPIAMDHLRQRPPGRAGRQAQWDRTTATLHERYQDAAASVGASDFEHRPTQIVHGDWHPGNMLFHGPKVVAVIDYDAARIQRRILDLANGALQFSTVGGQDDPIRWPDQLDLERYRLFLAGYASTWPGGLLPAEVALTGPLMIEALICQCVIPIATTGSFAGMDGLDVLRMVQRKVRWILEHADDLRHVVA